MNVDFRVKEVGAEKFVVELHVATLSGLRELIAFLLEKAKRTKPDNSTQQEG